jgi:hypothetical protein
MYSSKDLTINSTMDKEFLKSSGIDVFKSWSIFSDLDQIAPEVANQDSRLLSFLKRVSHKTDSFNDLRELYRQQRKKGRFTEYEKTRQYKVFYYCNNQLKTIHRFVKGN